jgi:dihydroorotate dehydrogenase (NAD+) catalytic subunit
MAFVPDVETLSPMLGTNAAFGGSWALPLTCRWLVQCRRRLGPNFPLIGTNGARTGLDLARFLLSGASAVQVSSAVFAGGFSVLPRMLQEFSAYLDRKNLTAGALIGHAADRLGTYQEQASRPDYWKSFVAAEALPSP